MLMLKIFDKLHQGIWIINKKGEIQYYNQRVLDELGYSRDRLKEKNIRDFTEGLELSKEQLEIYTSHERSIKFVTSEGRKKKFKCYFMKVMFEGKKCFAIIMDECEDKGYTQEDLEKLLSSVPQSVWLKDKKGRFVYINHGVREWGLGNDQYISPEKFIGKTVPESWEAIGEKFKVVVANKEDNLVYHNERSFEVTDEEIIRKKKLKIYEECLQHEDGKLWYWVCKVPIFDENNEVKLTGGIKRDITYDKKITEDFEESLMQFNMLNQVCGNEENQGIEYSILEHTKNEIRETLKAESLVIGVYDKEKEIMEFPVKVGDDIEKQPFTQDVKLEKERYEQFITRNIWGVKKVSEREHTRNIQYFKERGIRYVGILPIKYGSELVAIMVTTYKKKEFLSTMAENFEAKLCKQIGNVVKNVKLNRNLREEFQKRKKIEDELQTFLDISADLMGVIDQNGKLKKVSKGWSATLGWSEEELLQMEWKDIAILEKNTELNAFSRDRVGSESEEVCCRCKNGEYKWLEWRGRYVPEANQTIVTATDITSKKKREEERQAYKEAIKREEAKNELLTNVSHEFRTPINIILSGTKLLTVELEDNVVKEGRQKIDAVWLEKYINIMKQNGYRLLRLVNNLIDINKANTGSLKAKMKNEDLVALVEGVSLSTVHYLKQKQIELIFDTEEEEIIIACDAEKIERIMLNLLSNAVKYMGRPGMVYVTISVRSKEVVISVKDDGLGIPEKQLEHIFERFMQVNGGLSRQTEGSGLGLPIVKSLVELHGGSIKAISELGVGSEFIITLPNKQVEVENEKHYVRRMAENHIENYRMEFSDIYL